MPESYFPKEEYESRWSRVEEEMARRGFETALVWGRTASTFDRAGDVLYLANYFSTKVGQGFDAGAHNARAYAAVLLQRGQTPELHADDPERLAGLLDDVHRRFGTRVLGGCCGTDARHIRRLAERLAHR